MAAAHGHGSGGGEARAIVVIRAALARYTARLHATRIRGERARGEAQHARSEAHHRAGLVAAPVWRARPWQQAACRRRVANDRVAKFKNPTAKLGVNLIIKPNQTSNIKQRASGHISLILVVLARHARRQE